MEIKDFEDYHIFGNGRIVRQSTRREIKGWVASGYRCVEFWIKAKGKTKGKKKTKKIHRLVAQTYIPNPDNLPCVDHINKNKLDNRVENLRWVTVRENTTNTDAKGVYERKNGTYRAIIDTRGLRYNKTFKTEEEAIRWRNMMKVFCGYLS